VIREILQLRKAWRWGARKLHELLLEAHPRRRCRPPRRFIGSWCAMAASATAGGPGSGPIPGVPTRRSPAPM
jgi:hypothetical protein